MRGEAGREQGPGGRESDGTMRAVRIVIYLYELENPEVVSSKSNKKCEYVCTMYM